MTTSIPTTRRTRLMLAKIKAELISALGDVGVHYVNINFHKSPQSMKVVLTKFCDGSYTGEAESAAKSACQAVKRQVCNKAKKSEMKTAHKISHQMDVEGLKKNKDKKFMLEVPWFKR
ncbi:hypothetical protein MKW98_016468 [Papaver atlanticum]|uniref:Uncharacterized protein n=1 Tax=Papaver atlanticum TaxID=357466 RepID=A0AAD4T903_9MAGN|nr:hypothetical protein MKW98_016468 [Papaver atlanticum]